MAGGGGGGGGSSCLHHYDVLRTKTDMSLTPKPGGLRQCECSYSASNAFLGNSYKDKTSRVRLKCHKNCNIWLL